MTSIDEGVSDLMKSPSEEQAEVYISINEDKLDSVREQINELDGDILKELSFGVLKIKIPETKLENLAKIKAVNSIEEGRDMEVHTGKSKHPKRFIQRQIYSQG